MSGSVWSKPKRRGQINNPLWYRHLPPLLLLSTSCSAALTDIHSAGFQGKTNQSVNQCIGGGLCSSFWNNQVFFILWCDAASSSAQPQKTVWRTWQDAWLIYSGNDLFKHSIMLFLLFCKLFFFNLKLFKYPNFPFPLSRWFHQFGFQWRLSVSPVCLNAV